MNSQTPDPPGLKLTYPYNRPGPGEKKSYSYYDKNLKNKRSFNYATPSVESLEHINWDRIRAVEISNSGTSGVILVETGAGSFVIKGSPDPAVEYFATIFLEKLKISVPKVRVLEFIDPEFQEMIKAIDRASYIESSLKYRAKTRLDRPFVLLMEYIPGISFMGMGQFRARAALDPGFPEGRDRLIRLGILLAADCFLNNSDRLPLIWKNDGNPENVILRLETQWTTASEELKNPENLNLKMLQLYAIDTRPYLFDDQSNVSKSNYTSYLETYENLIKSIFEILTKVKEGKINPYELDAKRFDYGSLISTFIYNYTVYDMKPLGELQILLGMVLGFVNIKNFGYDRILELYKSTILKPKTDWMDIWKDNAKSMKITMITDLLKITSKILRSNEDIIQWVNVITLNNYILKFEEEVKPEPNKAPDDNNKDQPPKEIIDDSELDGKVKNLFGVSLEDVKKQQEYEENERKKKEEEEKRIAMEAERQKKLKEEEEERVRKQKKAEAEAEAQAQALAQKQKLEAEALALKKQEEEKKKATDKKKNFFGKFF